MKRFLQINKNRRWGYDAWALRIVGAPKPLDWTTSTTREEVRAVRDELLPLFGKLEVVKVRINVEVIADA